MKTVIDSFRGKYYFLSNYYEAPVLYDGILYKSNEAAFQAAKVMDKKLKLVFAKLPPNEAKKFGRKVTLRPDWEKIKYQVMEDIVRAKFTQNQNLAELLKNTGSCELVEGNTWGDKIWGMVNGEGQNELGKILMKIREEI